MIFGTHGCANVLTDDRSAPCGATTYNTNQVDVAPLRKDARAGKTIDTTMSTKMVYPCRGGAELPILRLSPGHTGLAIRIGSRTGRQRSGLNDDPTVAAVCPKA